MAQAAPVRPAHGDAVQAVAAALCADPLRGLDAQEARGRLARHGPNELPAQPPPPAWQKFLAHFVDPLSILLLVATAVSIALWALERDSALPYEAFAILAVVCLNAVMGFVQESRAEAAVHALRSLSPDQASVVRDDRRVRIAARELVPGDLLIIEEGDRIPADARVIESNALQASEAALTGESLPVAKQAAAIAADAALGDRINMIFSGTIATSGRGRALVTATGAHTQMGRVARLLEEAPGTTTPLQQELARTGRLLGGIVIVIAVVMIATIVVVQHVRGLAALLDVLILGVALAVAAVPEGLPAVVTAVLATGVQRMARRHAIVRRLAAVETLGSATVIASDKTGTLTRNEMTVQAVVTAGGRVNFAGSGYDPRGESHREDGGPVPEELRRELERALTAAERANNAALQQVDGHWSVRGDPTEGALLVAARKAGLDAGALAARLPRIGELPFSSDRKRMSTLHRDTQQDDRPVLFTKGAPEAVLALCRSEFAGTGVRPLTDERRAAIERANEALAGEALRVLGVAARTLDPSPAPGTLPADLEQDLVFAGLIGMIDPPRDEAPAAVARARAAGIRPLMITGDHPRTAAAIARALGIDTAGRALAGHELEQLDDDALARAVREVSVYARVSPEHKLRIVRALQRGGEVVAMTGDGVNDAPALKTADIGIAMGLAGTDVAKQAADMILADDDFATIVAAIEEGRTIFANIRKFLRYLLSSNIGEVLTMFLGVLLVGAIGLPGREHGLVLPLLATQILWINLVTDGLPALALGLDPPDAHRMAQPPRPPGERVISAGMWRGILLVGVVMAAGTLLLLDSDLPGGWLAGTADLRHAQTLAFTTLVLFQVFNVFNARSDDRSAFGDLFRNWFLWAAVAVSIASQVAVVHVPLLQNAFGTTALGAADWLRSTAVASCVLWVRELDKLAARAWRRGAASRRSA